MSRNTTYHYFPCTRLEPLMRELFSRSLYRPCYQSGRRGNFWVHQVLHFQWSPPSTCPEHQSLLGWSNRSTVHNNQLPYRKQIRVIRTSPNQQYPKSEELRLVHQPGFPSLKSQHRWLALYWHLPCCARTVAIELSCRLRNHPRWQFSRNFFFMTFWL